MHSWAIARCDSTEGSVDGAVLFPFHRWNDQLVGDFRNDLNPILLVHIFFSCLTFFVIAFLLHHCCTRMITVHIDPGRRHKASSEPLRLIKTTVNCCFTVLGSTGNACVVAVSNNSMSCTCPDSHPFCKHVLFLLQASGLSAQHVLTASSVNLL